MYSFQTGSTARKSKQKIRLLSLIIFILVIALAGVGFAYWRSRDVSVTVGEALMMRATSEASSAQTAVYRLTQSSGSNTMTLLATIRSHIYALQCLNQLAANIYGPDIVLADAQMLAGCITTLDECQTRLQTGGVLTDLTAQLRDQVEALVATFSEQTLSEQSAS